ncbi:hypothetical protein [Streptomyces salinarius]|uniref:hypothetical protein n=1 Tax=Streptomyces salinarius TaxID=2762598 RepID=UPI0013DC1183|nr:hypothetical protein [Streptomyces salinarius]
MGWGTRPKADAVRGTWSDEWSRAAALCAAQLPALWLAWWFAAESGADSYGYGGGGYLGILCLPLILPFFGIAHATVHIMPAAIFARLVPQRVREPEWAWRLAASVLLGACWFALGNALWGWGAAALAWCAVAGVLPVLGLAALRGRRWGAGRVWLLSAGAGFLLFVAVVPIGEVLADDYEPPALSAGRLAGDWKGDDGAVLRLSPGGRAELTRLPTERDIDEHGDFTRCEGTGTWTLERQDRDRVVLTPDGDCGLKTEWTVGGTEHAPELYVRFGDPDSGDLRILTRR